MPLFTVRERKNRARRRPGEDWFAFLERVGPDRYFARVRDLVDAWFDELPSEQAEALRPRLIWRTRRSVRTTWCTGRVSRSTLKPSLSAIRSTARRTTSSRSLSSRRY